LVKKKDLKEGAIINVFSFVMLRINPINDISFETKQKSSHEKTHIRHVILFDGRFIKCAGRHLFSRFYPGAIGSGYFGEAYYFGR
jgi:hypothetical protein